MVGENAMPVKGHTGFLSFFTIPQLFSSEECASIIALGTRSPLSQAQTSGPGGYVVNSEQRNVQVALLGRAAQAGWVFERMDEAFFEASKRYGFDVSDVTEDIKFLVYDVGCHFDAWHMDLGGAHAAGRKISMSVELSPAGAYAGGRLEIFPDAVDDTLSIQQGGAVLFPSFRFHRVRPVTMGTRYSLVNWINGPPFR